MQAYTRPIHKPLCYDETRWRKGSVLVSDKKQKTKAPGSSPGLVSNWWQVLETLRNRSSINPAATIGPVAEGLAPIYSQVAQSVEAAPL